MFMFAQRLRELIGRFRPSEPAESDSNSTSGSGNATSSAAVNTDASPAPISIRSLRSTRDAVSHLQSGYDEMIKLMQTVQIHMEGQSERSERLLTLMDKMPDALASMPELNRNQIRIMEALQDHFQQEGRRSQDLNKTVHTLAQMTEQHGHLMGAMQQQLDANHEVDQQMVGSFSALNRTLNRLHDSSQASTEMWKQISEFTNGAENRMNDLLQRNHKFTLSLMSGMAAVMVVSLGIAAYTGVMASRIQYPDSQVGATATVVAPPEANSEAAIVPTNLRQAPLVPPMDELAPIKIELENSVVDSLPASTSTDPIKLPISNDESNATNPTDDSVTPSSLESTSPTPSTPSTPSSPSTPSTPSSSSESSPGTSSDPSTSLTVPEGELLPIEPSIIQVSD